MNTISSDVLTARFSALYGTAKRNSNDRGYPKPSLTTPNAQICSPVPQNSFLSPASIFNGQMNTNSSNALTAHFSTLYGMVAPRHPQSPLERQAQHPFICQPNSPATEPLQSATNSPAAAILHLPSPVIIPVPSQHLSLCSPLIRQTHASASSPRNSAKLRSPHFQTHGLLKLDLVISYSVALLFDSVSCRVLLSCRWPPHLSHCVVSEANNQ